MMRIHLTDQDLANTRVAATPDWTVELEMSLYALVVGPQDARFHQWRQEIRTGWDPRFTKLLDFFAPTHIPEIFTILPEHRATAAGTSTPLNDVARRDLADFATTRPLSSLGRGLLASETRAHTLLGELTGTYQRLAVTRFWDQITEFTALDHRRRTRSTGATGIDAILSTLHPLVTWRRPVLEIPLFSEKDIDIRLSGRGLILQPSVFAAWRPVLSEFLHPQPVLIYPTHQDGHILGHHEPSPLRALIPLLGRTRTAVLDTVAAHPQITTQDLARRLRISHPSASQHATVLCNAGLTTKERSGTAVIHSLTSLGATLLAGGTAPPGAADEPVAPSRSH